jgi:uncharacterized protein (DUF2062 family)
MKKVAETKDKFIKTVKKLLTEGVTPEKLGLTVMLGFLFGIIPIIGINSIILAFIALKWRLNMVIIQIINYAVYPIQLMLLVPFYKAGQWIFQTKGALNVSFSDFIELFSTNFFHAASEFSIMILKGITVWILIAIPLGYLIYSIFVYLFKNILVQIARKGN